VRWQAARGDRPLFSYGKDSASAAAHTNADHGGF
jgi:hypothetical protein